MAKYNNQKAKILFLQQMLCETGENHAISMQQILERLQEKDIRAERKSIYDDMEVLRYFGMDIRFKRERPSGYYMAGIAPVELPKLVIRETEKKEKEKEEIKQKKPEVPEAETWVEGENTQELRVMKLQCTEAGRQEVMRVFGSGAQFKEKEDGLWVVTVEAPENRRFYGWLTGAGEDARLLKPKKTIQLYREYLKSLAKEYKIEK